MNRKQLDTAKATLARREPTSTIGSYFDGSRGYVAVWTDATGRWSGVRRVSELKEGKHD